MSSRFQLVLFVVGVLGLGLLIGSITTPDGWYAALAKPSFNPPNWLFPPVWSVLYVMIGIAGWRVWRLALDGGLFKLWLAQLLLNFAWTPVFFAMHQIALALCIILLLFIAILVFIGMAWKRDPVAAWLFVPYAAWVGYAGLLNGAILLLNR